MVDALLPENYLRDSGRHQIFLLVLGNKSLEMLTAGYFLLPAFHGKAEERIFKLCYLYRLQYSPSGENPRLLPDNLLEQSDWQFNWGGDVLKAIIS